MAFITSRSDFPRQIQTITLIVPWLFVLRLSLSTRMMPQPFLFVNGASHRNAAVSAAGEAASSPPPQNAGAGRLRASRRGRQRSARKQKGNDYGGKPMTEPWYRRIFRRRTTKVVYLAAPVAMEIRS
jgi:hypothetical protein